MFSSINIKAFDNTLETMALSSSKLNIHRPQLHTNKIIDDGKFRLIEHLLDKHRKD